MLRSVLTFFSTLAIAVMSAAALVSILPWLSGQTPGASLGGAANLHFESLVLGVVIGIMVGWVSRFEWGDIPRRMITWVLVRERQFFYYALIGGCIAVLLFY